MTNNDGKSTNILFEFSFIFNLLPFKFLYKDIVKCRKINRFQDMGLIFEGSVTSFVQVFQILTNTYISHTTRHTCLVLWKRNFGSN